MEKLKIVKENAIKVHAAADANGKKLLEDLFEPGVFEPVCIMERVKSWEDACAIKGLHPIKCLPFPNEANTFEAAVNGVVQMWIIRDVLCEGWEPKPGELYYEIRYKRNESGFGFLRTIYAAWYAYTCVGARLQFPNAKLCIYAGSHPPFLKIANKYLNKYPNEI
jgi:hypothetical protein